MLFAAKMQAVSRKLDKIQIQITYVGCETNFKQGF